MKNKCSCGGKIVLEKRSSNYYSASGKEYLHGEQKDVYVCLKCKSEDVNIENIIGGELDEKYFDISVERLKQESRNG